MGVRVSQVNNCECVTIRKSIVHQTASEHLKLRESFLLVPTNMPILKLFGGSKNKAGSEGRDKIYNDDGGDSKRSEDRRVEQKNRMKDSDKGVSKNYENGRLSKISPSEYREQRRDRRADERTSVSSKYRRRSKSMESRLSRNDRDEGRRWREKDENSDSGQYRTRSSSLVSRRSRSVKDSRKERLDGGKDGGRKDKDELSRASSRYRRRSKSVGSRRRERGKSKDPNRVTEDGSRRKDKDELSRASSRRRRRSISVGSRRRERGKSKDPKRVTEDDDLKRSESRFMKGSSSVRSKSRKRRDKDDGDVYSTRSHSRIRSRSKSTAVTKDEDLKRSESRFRKRSSSVRSKSTKRHDKDDGDVYSTRSDSRIRSRSKADDDVYSTRSDSRIKSRSKSVADSRNRVGMPVNGSGRKKTDVSSPDGSRRSEVERCGRKGRRGEIGERRRNDIDSECTRRDELETSGLRYGNERERGIGSILESKPYFGGDISIKIPQGDGSVGRVYSEQNNARPVSYNTHGGEASVKDLALLLNSNAGPNSFSKSKQVIESEIGTIEDLKNRNTGSGSNINNVEQVPVVVPTYLRNGVQNQQTEALPMSFQCGSQVPANMRDLSRQSDQRPTVSGAQSIKDSFSTQTQTWRCSSCSNVNDGGRLACANCGVALPLVKTALPDPNLSQVRHVNPSDQPVAMQHSNMYVPNSALVVNRSHPSHSAHKQHYVQHHITSSSAQDRPVTAWRCESCSNINEQSRPSCMNCGVEAIPSLKGKGDACLDEDQVQSVMLTGGIHNGIAGININATNRNEEQGQARQTIHNKAYPSNQRHDRFGHQATGTTVVTIQSRGDPDRLHNPSHSPLPVRNDRHEKTKDSVNAFAASENSWTCLECHSGNMNSGQFCTSCGTKAGVSSKASLQSFPINNMPISWNCGQCAHANDDEDIFCKHCGANRMSNLSLPAAGPPVQQQISFSCSSCGNITGGDSCKYCGCNAQSTQQEYSGKTQKSISAVPGTCAQPMFWRCVCSHKNESRRPFCEKCGAKAIDKGQPSESSAPLQKGSIPQCALGRNVLSEIEDTKGKAQKPEYQKSPGKGIFSRRTSQKKTPVMHKQMKQNKHRSYEHSRQPTSSSECESSMRNSQYDVISPSSNAHASTVPQSALNLLVLADIASGSASLKSPNPTENPTAKVSLLSQLKKGKGLRSVEKRKLAEAPPMERPMSIFDQIMSGPQLKKVEKMDRSPSSSIRDGKFSKI